MHHKGQADKKIGEYPPSWRAITHDGESLCMSVSRVICNIYYINFHHNKAWDICW